MLVLSIIFLFLIAFLQNASFLLISRAHPNPSLRYQLVASAIINILFIAVLGQVVISMPNWLFYLTYIIGAMAGDIASVKMSVKIKKLNKPLKGKASDSFRNIEAANAERYLDSLIREKAPGKNGSSSS